MDLAGISAVMSLGKVQQQVSISVMKLAMDLTKTKGNIVTELVSSASKL